MAHAVNSCLHANLAAFTAVLGDIEQQGNKTSTCPGDLVGYGAQPNDVVGRVGQRANPTGQGRGEGGSIERRHAGDGSETTHMAQRRGEHHPATPPHDHGPGRLPPSCGPPPG